MKVGISNTFRHFTACGQGRYLINLLQALRSVDSSIQYFEIGPRIPEPKWGERVGKSKSEVFWELFGATRDALRYRVDILHNPYWTSPVFPSPRTVVTVHDIVPVHPSFKMYRDSWKSKVYYSLISQTTRYARAIITDSKASALDIHKVLGIHSSKIHVIYLAPDSRFYKVKDEAMIEEFRKKFGLEMPYILYVASGFDYRKNIFNLIEAFEMVLSSLGPKVMLVITGDLRSLEYPASKDPRPLVAQKKLDGLVKFTGFVQDDDMPCLYQGACISVFPSLYEGGGLALLEALASGIPVLASNRGAFPELAEEAAVLVDAMDQRQIVKGLLRLLQDRRLREEQGLRALERSLLFSWEQTARETIEIYKHVLH